MALFGVLGFFGKVPFTCSSEQVATFQNLQIQRQSRYATHDVLGQKPVHEYVGPALTTVSFKIQLRSYLKSSPEVYLSLLKDMLESGDAQRLLLGPKYYGKYVLTGFSEDQKFFNGLGTCIAADVSLQLEEAQGFSLVQYLKSMI